MTKEWFCLSGVLAVAAMAGCPAPCPADQVEYMGICDTRQTVGGMAGAESTGGGGGDKTTGEMSGSSSEMSGSGGQVVCGDGIVEGGEECDNESNTDPPWQLAEPAAGACAAGCLAVGWCGDGVKQEVEDCDNGSNTDVPWQMSGPAADACAAGCVAVQWCGDGIKQEVEGCDNGSNTDAPWQMSEPAVDACAAGCVSVEWCGDGTKQEAEDCDNGSNTDAPWKMSEPAADACAAGCVAVRWCGDGVEQEAEACDDGNMKNDDQCTTLCEPRKCGDGFVQAGEMCDDGNMVDTDACSNECEKPRIVFLTSQPFDGDLEGFDGADAKCKKAAEDAELAPGATWRAWLSDDTGSPADVDGRFDKKFAGWYRLVNGTPVAKGWAGLTDGTLDASIKVTEKGDTLVGAVVWSNTATNGTKIEAGSHCKGWSSDAALSFGHWAYSSMTDEGWTDSKAIFAWTCGEPLHLYCFQYSP